MVVSNLLLKWGTQIYQVLYLAQYSLKTSNYASFKHWKSKVFFLMFSFKYEEYVIKFNDIYNALAPAIFINEAIT